MKVSRREAMKLASAGAMAGLQSGASAKPRAVDRSVALWDVFEVQWTGPANGNPFTDVQFGATFSLGHRRVEVEGFYDGNGVYKLRFMPDTQGVWSYTTTSNRPELQGHTGQFTAVAAGRGVHGPVRVANTHHFAHADGTAYLPFGTTCYAWIHQSDALQQQTLKTLAGAPFTKLRMCLFPKHYEYNHNEPALYPFARDAAGKSNFAVLNPSFFAHVERRILDLQALGIEADLILFHPYDRWGYASMPAEADDRYLRYVLARLSAFRNVWWSMANEFDLMRAKTTADFDRLFHIVEQYDPYAHLRSIHYSHTMYDYARPWVTHASIQTYDFDAAPRFLLDWNKPVVYDEVQYEGNLNKRWGNVSGAELTRRFWLGTVRGCYVTHGETYLTGEGIFDEGATPTLWWSHGGELHGTSPRRIAFLRKLLEGMMERPGVRAGLQPAADQYYLNASVLASDGKRTIALLYYFDFHQPVWYEFPLPAGQFTAEAVDPDAETITPLEGKFSGKAKLRLSGRPYQAIVFRSAGS